MSKIQTILRYYISTIFDTAPSRIYLYPKKFHDSDENKEHPKIREIFIRHLRSHVCKFVK